MSREGFVGQTIESVLAASRLVHASHGGSNELAKFVTYTILALLPIAGLLLVPIGAPMSAVLFGVAGWYAGLFVLGPRLI